MVPGFPADPLYEQTLLLEAENAPFFSDGMCHQVMASPTWIASLIAIKEGEFFIFLHIEK